MRKVLWVFIVVAGCGGGDGGPSTFDPSAPGGTPLNQLDATQATALCTEELTYEDNAFSPASQVEYTCRAAGYEAVGIGATTSSTDAEIQAFCMAGYNACKSNPPMPAPSTDIAMVCATAMATLPACTATVNQYAACINERARSVPKTLVPCSQVTKAKVLELLLTPDGPACAAFNPACPALAASALMASPLKMATH